MTRGQKILTIVIGLLVLVLVGILLFWNPAPQVNAPVANNNVSQNANVGGQLPGGDGGFNANVAPNANETAPPPPSDPAGNLRRVAAAFAERYGSFSNNGNFENLTDLAPFMTPAFAASTAAYVEEQRNQPRAAEYSGTTTRALSVTVDSLDETGGTAVIRVNTQRRAQGATPGSDTVYYQELRLTFAKSGESWLVGSATWMPRP